jgi:hypothetical protein
MNKLVKMNVRHKIVIIIIYLLWNIITEGDNNYLTHLLKIGLDINKCDYNGNTLLCKILNRPRWISVYKLKHLMEHFEDVNVGDTNWISLLETKRGLVRQIEKYTWWVILSDEPYNHGYNALSEFRKHVRRNSI